VEEKKPETTKVERGDLVATYILNSSLIEPKLVDTGIVLSCDEQEQRVLVYNFRMGDTRWWNRNRWKVLSKN